MLKSGNRCLLIRKYIINPIIDDKKVDILTKYICGDRCMNKFTSINVPRILAINCVMELYIIVFVIKGMAI